jgi:Cdc6-like AAA superfamily ATPase
MRYQYIKIRGLITAELTDAHFALGNRGWGFLTTSELYTRYKERYKDWGFEKAITLRAFSKQLDYLEMTNRIESRKVANSSRISPRLWRLRR